MKRNNLLVVIDTKNLIYKAFQGRKRLLKVQSDVALNRREVELFRVNPYGCITPEPNNAA